MSSRVRHVWVRQEHIPSELPGLVLEWRQTPDGWEAQVVYVDPGGSTTIEWVPAGRLRPVEGSAPRTGSAYG